MRGIYKSNNVNHMKIKIGFIILISKIYGKINI